MSTINHVFMKLNRIYVMLGQIKNKCVSGNESENFKQCRYTCFFLKFVFLEQKYNFMHFERHFAFQNA